MWQRMLPVVVSLGLLWIFLNLLSSNQAERAEQAPEYIDPTAVFSKEFEREIGKARACYVDTKRCFEVRRVCIEGFEYYSSQAAGMPRSVAITQNGINTTVHATCDMPRE